MICDKFDSCGLHCPYFQLSGNGNMPNGNQCNNPDAELIPFSELKVVKHSKGKVNGNMLE